MATLGDGGKTMPRGQENGTGQGNATGRKSVEGQENVPGKENAPGEENAHGQETAYRSEERIWGTFLSDEKVVNKQGFLPGRFSKQPLLVEEITRHLEKENGMTNP